MKIKLDTNHEGKWQVDVLLPDGREFHSVGDEPWEALIELGIFWSGQPKPSDTADLFRVIVGSRDGGCDANGGWNHRPISIPSAVKDIFCQDCGEMLDKATAKRHLSAAANRTPSEMPAAIRARKGDAM